MTPGDLRGHDLANVNLATESIVGCAQVVVGHMSHDRGGGSGGREVYLGQGTSQGSGLLWPKQARALGGLRNPDIQL
jgi:hypothetical protein